MTEPKNFKKGKHSYTRYGANFKEVHVPGQPAEPVSPSGQVAFDIDPQTELGVYVNATLVHQTRDEVIFDFCFRLPGANRARVRSRVVMSPKQADELRGLLEKAAAARKV